MNRNHVFLMKIFFRGTVTFGLGTIMTTIILNLSNLFTFRGEEDKKRGLFTQITTTTLSNII